MVNGKNVKFRETSCEKSPSPKRFKEPDDLTDIDLRRLSEISGFSDSSFKNFNPKSVKKKLCKLLFVITSLVVGFLILYLILSKQGINPWEILTKHNQNDDLNTIVSYYIDKLERCKTLKTLESCCSIFLENDINFIVEDCTVDKMLAAIVQHETKPKQQFQNNVDGDFFRILNPSLKYEEYDYFDPEVHYGISEVLGTDQMYDSADDKLLENRNKKDEINQNSVQLKLPKSINKNLILNTVKLKRQANWFNQPQYLQNGYNTPEHAENQFNNNHQQFNQPEYKPDQSYISNPNYAINNDQQYQQDVTNQNQYAGNNKMGHNNQPEIQNFIQHHPVDIEHMTRNLHQIPHSNDDNIQGSINHHHTIDNNAAAEFSNGRQSYEYQNPHNLNPINSEHVNGNLFPKPHSNDDYSRRSDINHDDVVYEFSNGRQPHKPQKQEAIINYNPHMHLPEHRNVVDDLKIIENNSKVNYNHPEANLENSSDQKIFKHQNLNVEAYNKTNLHIIEEENSTQHHNSPQQMPNQIEKHIPGHTTVNKNLLPKPHSIDDNSRAPNHDNVANEFSNGQQFHTSKGQEVIVNHNPHMHFSEHKNVVDNPKVIENNSKNSYNQPETNLENQNLKVNNKTNLHITKGEINFQHHNSAQKMPNQIEEHNIHPVNSKHVNENLLPKPHSIDDNSRTPNINQHDDNVANEFSNGRQSHVNKNPHNLNVQVLDHKNAKSSPKVTNTIEHNSEINIHTTKEENKTQHHNSSLKTPNQVEKHTTKHPVNSEPMNKNLLPKPLSNDDNSRTLNINQPHDNVRQHHDPQFQNADTFENQYNKDITKQTQFIQTNNPSDLQNQLNKPLLEIAHSKTDHTQEFAIDKHNVHSNKFSNKLQEASTNKNQISLNKDYQNVNNTNNLQTGVMQENSLNQDYYPSGSVSMDKNLLGISLPKKDNTTGSIIELERLNPNNIISNSTDAPNLKMRINADTKIAQFTSASEDLQTSQHTSVNPSFNQRQCLASYTPPLGSPLPLMQQQVPYSYDPNTRFAQLVPITVPRSQANSYVINPQYTYVTPGFSQQVPNFQTVYPNGQMINQNLQAAGSGGQYYICNPVTAPSDNRVTGMPGVEVRQSDTINYQQLLTSPLHKGLTRDSDACPDDYKICADESKCIKENQICDGEVHCVDGSDEAYCSCKYRIGSGRVCDGYYDCPNGEDEIGCFGCPRDTFSCDDWSYHRKATCIPLYERCNGIENCPAGKDEQDCSALLGTVETNNSPNKISLNVGYLHRNFKGVWYPVCANPEVWSLDACKDEAGPSVLPPLTQTVPIDYDYKGHFISALPNRKVKVVESCFAAMAVHVECPQPTCGLRKITRNPYRPEEVDTSAEEILSLFRPTRSINDTLVGDGRVVGGKACQPGAWPWVVSIYKNGAFHCGGVLISDHWLITAAHCVEKYWQYYYEIELGMLRRFSYSPMQQTRYVSHIIPHAAYDRANLKNDLALMRLNTPVKYNRYVRPICLPTEFTAGQYYDKGPLPGTVCTAVGWGATVEHGPDPDHMREVEVPILPNCKHKEDAEGNEICAGLLEGGKDACQGDSGGPFMCRNPNIPNQWYLAGIVSHGEGCARPNEPGVYTRITLYRDWIYEYAKDDMLPQRTPLHHCPGYVCKTINKCIPKKRRCDKIVDCLYGDDEMECEKANPFSSLFKHAMRHMITGYGDLSRTNEEPSQKPREEAETTVDSISETTFKMEYNPITDIVNRNGFAEDDISFASPALISDQNKFISNTEAATIASVDITSQPDSVDASSPETFHDNFSNKEDAGTVMIKPFKGERFLCTKMMEIIPLVKKCDKVIDCQDGTDEESCNCADYLKNSYPEAICDGITDCRDLSDEKDCDSCSEGYFYCRLSKTCIPIEKKCNNNADCKFNEDEWDCFTLADKYHIELDLDMRPKLKVKGVLAANREGNWMPMCGNFTGKEANIAADVCISLGFSDYEKYLQLVVADRSLKVVQSSDDGSEIPSATGNDTCNGLYIKCSNVTITAHEIGNEDRLNAPNELYTSPWNAAIYADGEYKCTGTILNLNWILTSINCFPGILKLNQHYVSALLGTGRGHLNVGGPHEQIIPIVETIQVAQSKAVLLRLRENIEFTRYVRPLHFQRKGDFIRYKETCVAMGTDRNQTSRAVLLKPVQNCTTGSRCFKRLDGLSSECEVSNHINPWSGCIVCDSGNGFYPAAIFYELRGDCGFSHTRSLQSISNIKRDIYQTMNRAAFNVEPPICSGFRCNLGKCIEKEKLCNGIPDCRNGADENNNTCSKLSTDCHLSGTCVCAVSEMRCSNGKCVPKIKFCDQVNDCGDGSDEPERCNCQSYLRLADPTKVCDGIRNCLDRTDENPMICDCNKGQFKCGLTPYCIPNDMVCDGYRDCPDNEDETRCLSLYSPRDNPNVGEVKTRTAGIWHSGCWPEHLMTTELEDVCKALGFTGNKAALWNTNSDNTTTPRPVIDNFNFVWIHRKTNVKVKLAMRSGIRPYLSFKDDPNCHKLFIECI